MTKTDMPINVEVARDPVHGDYDVSMCMCHTPRRIYVDNLTELGAGKSVHIYVERKTCELVAKLRELVDQMYRDMQGVLDMSTDTVFVDSIGTLRDMMDLHMQAMAELGMPPMDYEDRMRELGMEVD